jgi:hypothetical protein
MDSLLRTRQSGARRTDTSTLDRLDQAISAWTTAPIRQHTLAAPLCSRTASTAVAARTRLVGEVSLPLLGEERLSAANYAAAVGGAEVGERFGEAQRSELVAVGGEHALQRPAGSGVLWRKKREAARRSLQSLAAAPIERPIEGPVRGAPAG